MSEEQTNPNEEKTEKVEAEEVKAAPKKRKPLDLHRGGLIWTIWNFTEAALLLVAGILAIAFSNNTSLQNSIFAVVGAFLIVGGALKILMNFLPVLATNDYEMEAKVKAKAALSYDLVVGGALELALGVTLLTIFIQNQTQAISAITSFISTFIAIILIVVGANLLLFAIGFIVTKLYKIYLPILEIILAAALIALGIFVLIKMSDQAVFLQVVLIIVGIIMALAGIGMLVSTFAGIKEAKAKKKEAQESYDKPADDKTVVGEADYTETAPEKKPEDGEKKD